MAFEELAVCHDMKIIIIASQKLAQLTQNVALNLCSMRFIFIIIIISLDLGNGHFECNGNIYYIIKWVTIIPFLSSILFSFFFVKTYISFEVWSKKHIIWDLFIAIVIVTFILFCFTIFSLYIQSIVFIPCFVAPRWSLCGWLETRFFLMGVTLKFWSWDYYIVMQIELIRMIHLCEFGINLIILHKFYSLLEKKGRTSG